MTEREIFLAAIEIEDADKRAAFLDQACSDDAELRAQVDQLLESHEQTSQFLEVPAAAFDSALQVTHLSGAHNEGDTVDNWEEEFRNRLEATDREGFIGRLGHYEVESILGRGAFGIVAKAFDKKLHRVVAIKMMSPELASTSPPRKRFLREARTAAAVNHENIAAIYAVEEEPIPYLVMEYVAGPTLQERMNAKGPFEIAEVLEIGKQIASGLAAAHAVNLIHRDIKPSNILLSEGPQERSKISDFGLARAVDDASMTQSGMIAGTPMYMAPEQARGETLDHRADLFSLGSVLYQMTSGRPPFRASNTVAVLKRVCDDEPRPIPDIIRETPPWLCATIAKLMEKDRERRFESAADVFDLFDRCQRELQQYGKVTSVEAGSPGANSKEKPLAKSNQIESRKRSLGLMIGGVIPIVALIGFVLVNQWQPSRSEQGKLDQANSKQLESVQDVKKNKALIFDGENDYVHIPYLKLPVDEAIAVELKVAILENQLVHNSPVIYWRSNSHEYYLGPRILSGKTYWRFFITDRYGNNEWWDICEMIKGRIYSIKLQLDQDNTPTFTVDNARVKPAKYKTKPEDQSQKLVYKAGQMATNGLNLGGKFNADGSPQGVFRGALFNVHITGESQQSTNNKSGNKTIARYHFDEGEGARLTDASGNGYDGIIVGAKWIDGEKLALNRDLIKGWHGWSADAPPPAIAPFDADQAKQHQQAWAKYLGVPVEYENSIGMKFRLIPPGEFMMGSSADERAQAIQHDSVEDHDLLARIQSEGPLHPVVVTKPFYLSMTEVTENEYTSVIEAPTSSNDEGPSNPSTRNTRSSQLPVVMVNWDDAQAFCKQLSQAETDIGHSGQPGASGQRLQYRLPTEAEWEYACRAGSNSLFWNGDEFDGLTAIAWIGSNSDGERHPVGLLPANPFGLHDIHGNVWEFVQDRWSENFYDQFAQRSAINPVNEGAAQGAQIVRGGSKGSGSLYCRAATRRQPSAPDQAIGFRVALTVEAVKERLQEKSALPQTHLEDPWHGLPADAPQPAIAPFDAEQAKKYQKEWAEYLGVPVEHKNSFGMKSRLIPPGEFMMGSTPDEIEAALESYGEVQQWKERIKSEAPQHPVILSEPFYMSITEVTQSHYLTIMNTNPSSFSHGGDKQELVVGHDTSDFPVDHISLNDAAEFCSQLAQNEGLEPFYRSRRFKNGRGILSANGIGMGIHLSGWNHYLTLLW